MIPNVCKRTHKMLDNRPTTSAGTKDKNEKKLKLTGF